MTFLDDKCRAQGRRLPFPNQLRPWLVVSLFKASNDAVSVACGQHVKALDRLVKESQEQLVARRGVDLLHSNG